MTPEFDPRLFPYFVHTLGDPIPEGETDLAGICNLVHATGADRAAFYVVHITGIETVLCVKQGDAPPLPHWIPADGNLRLHAKLLDGEMIREDERPFLNPRSHSARHNLQSLLMISFRYADSPVLYALSLAQLNRPAPWDDAVVNRLLEIRAEVSMMSIESIKSPAMRAAAIRRRDEAARKEA